MYPAHAISRRRPRDAVPVRPDERSRERSPERAGASGPSRPAAIADGAHDAREDVMRRVLWSVVACAAALSMGSAAADDERSLAERVEALEASARRLLAEVEALRAAAPRSATQRVELADRYRREVGEALPPEVLEREAAALERETRLLTDAAVRRAVEAKRGIPAGTALASPLVLLQVRGGAGAGRTSRVDMRGRLSPHVARRSPEAIPWEPTVDPDEGSVAHALGGRIPDGKAFVVTKLTWRASVAGASHGASFAIRLGTETIARESEGSASFEGSWTGRMTIRRGEEADVRVEIAGSSAAEARFEGELVDEER
jgi:hypothetical protein